MVRALKPWPWMLAMFRASQGRLWQGHRTQAHPERCVKDEDAAQRCHRGVLNAAGVPANMGYFSLLVMETGWAGWDQAILKNVIPAGIGHLIGGTLLVALPFRYAFKQLAEPDPDEGDPGDHLR